jgi:hypothetical protein
MKIIALLVLPVAVAVSFVWFQPRQYEARATLWALKPYSVIGATGAESVDTYSTYATTQATALTELLQTNAFDTSVANQTDLASTFDAATRADPTKLSDAIRQELSLKVTVTPVGQYLYEITYDNKDRGIAKQVVAAVVQEFGAVAPSYSVVGGNQLMQTYQKELADAEKADSAATKAAAAYLLSHPGATPQNDPTYSELFQAEQGTHADVADLQGTITKLNQSLAASGGSDSLYTVIDAPSVSSQPISRTKTLGLGGGVGLAIGLLAVTILLVALRRRDRSAYSADDLRRITGVPVMIELPDLPRSVIAASQGDPTLRALTGARRS